MIEVNLIPDVKQELLKARKIRNTVVSVSVIASIIAAGIVILMASYVFAGQWAQNTYFDNRIKEEQEKVEAIDGAADLLTIQNQLSVLPKVHDDKHMTSRLFSILSAINPNSPNNINISKVALVTEDQKITIEGQAANGYKALETFQKTIQATNLEYMVTGSSELIVEPLASELTIGDTSFGEDDSGKRILRFSITFIYNEELFARSSTQLSIVGPVRRNVTDSFVGIPEGLFTDRADDIEEEQ